jgi:hypothetical protein
MLKHLSECVVTPMSLNIIHPSFLNLNLQWLVTKNTRKETSPRNMFLLICFSSLFFMENFIREREVKV